MVAMTIEQAFAVAIAHHRAGRFAEAEEGYRKILVHRPQHAQALHLLGIVAFATHRYVDAAILIQRAIAASPAEASYHSDLGLTYRIAGRLDEAAVCFRRAVELNPSLAAAHLNLGEALHEMSRFDDAIESYQRVFLLQPNDAGAYNNLGVTLTAKGLMDEAITAFQGALALNADYAEAHNNLGNALCECGRWDEAAAAFRRALVLMPDSPEAHANLGNVLLANGRVEQALACNRELVARRPDLAIAHWNLAHALLLAGQFEEGWREYEWRFPINSSRRDLSAPRWDGTAAIGETILLHAEQGLGDTLHFFRYVPLVGARSGAGRVLLECQASLVRLLSQSAGSGVEIIARDPSLSVPSISFDRQLPLLSLPLVLQEFEPVSSTHSYLRADPDACARWRERLAPRPSFRIGFAWKGNPTHKEDHRRSINLDRFMPLLRLPGICFYSLQIGTDSRESHQLADAGLFDLTNYITDFADTAALMSELDLIITVDTATAHLAGALGRPVWVLLPLLPDWRWGLKGNQTRWYPTMRLFRQESAGDWEAVLSRAMFALTAIAREGLER
jgi:tetratricopeptide (TPR) repeat protein